MLSLLARLTARRRAEDGASAVEYGLLVAAIAGVVVVVVFALGSVVKGSFGKTCSSMKAGTGNTTAVCS